MFLLHLVVEVIPFVDQKATDAKERQTYTDFYADRGRKSSFEGIGKSLE